MCDGASLKHEVGDIADGARRALGFHVRVADGEHLFCHIVVCGYAPCALCLQPAVADFERTTAEEQGASVALYAEFSAAVAPNCRLLFQLYASRASNINGVCADQLYRKVVAGFVQDGVIVICLNSGVVERQGSGVRVERHLAAHSADFGEVITVVARNILSGNLDAIRLLRQRER